MSAPFAKTISIGADGLSRGLETKESLSIELLPDGFSYCILDHQHFRYQVMESFRALQPLNENQWAQAIDHLVRENANLSVSYQKVNISWFSTKLILVPFDLFKHAQKETYYGYANNLPENNLVLADRLNNLQAYGLYEFPAELKARLEFFFPAHRIRHSGSVLIESILAARQLDEWNASLVLHIRRKHFDILLLEENKLLYYNSFLYEEFGDLMYYLFFVLEQFELDANQMEALLLGEISLDSERFINLSQYFKKITFIGRNDVFHYHSEFDALPHHYFYNLLNLNSCG